MLFSILQQAMRQDPAYYRLYAALRPDQQWRLVTYPYYTKFARPGDKTYFRHIDLNVPSLINAERGAALIQGSLLLDDEDDDNCTVLIAGMQHKLADWWARCVAQGQETDGFVHRITETMFTEEDANVLGCSWKKVPCRRGEVRVTLPHLPHSQDGPASIVRRTMLPWFIGVQGDHQTLDILEAGTWDELAISHRDLEAPRSTPSGLANRYGAIPYRFPAAVELTGLGALSDALVCRRRWTSAAVLRERDILLGADRDAAAQFISQWRERAVIEIVAAFNLVRSAEARHFGEASFFYHLHRQRELGVPIPILDSEEEDLADESDDEEGDDLDGELLFAEMGEPEESGSQGTTT